jgi:hypothetical protein
MLNFVINRGRSMTMVVLVLLVIMVLQGSISYSTSFGNLDSYVAGMRDNPLSTGWLGLRVLMLAIIVVLWILNRKRDLFKAIILANGIFTLGLIINVAVLMAVLTGFSSQAVKSLLIDVFLLAVTNILIFSIWYWIIDPPGVEENQREDTPWDFLFPQRGSSIPHYESWVPRYTDYLYLAFTASFSFSPTDTLPLSRRAKWLMLLQATISIITLTGIAGSAINILAGNA